MLDIAAPPAPQLGVAIDLACAAGGLGAGVCLILWGRSLHRLVMVLAMAGLGALVAGTIGAWLKDTDATVVLVCTVVLFGVAGLLIAKAAWAFALAVLVNAGLLIVLASHFQPPAWPPTGRVDNASFPAWAHATGRTLSDFTARTMWVEKDAYWTFGPAGKIQWTAGAWKVQVAVAATGLAVFILALFTGSLPAFLICSLLGACCCLGGLAMLFDWLRPAFWSAAWSHPLAVAISLVVLTIVGLALQYRALARHRRQEEARKEERKGKEPAKGA